MTESYGAIPDYMRPVVLTGPPPSAGAVAEQSILALNTSMLQIYEDSLAAFKQNMLDRVPVILAMFSGAGGEMILYRPGRDPEVAPAVPIVYQLAKSVAHSSMAIYEIVGRYLSDARGNTLWRAPLQVYRTQNQTALETVDDLAIPQDQRNVLGQMLQRNLAFMDQCLAAGGFTYAELEDYARGITPLAAKAIDIAAGVQVGHWMQVLDGWRSELGSQWQQTFAASNTIYATRTNNVIFTILAQFMGTETIGDRLLLIETQDFETTPDQLLDSVFRIIADRSLSMIFFRDFYLMDVELLGGGGRDAIEREMAERGQPSVLPTLAPFRSNDWPWKTDPTKGSGPARMEDVAMSCPMFTQATD